MPRIARGDADFAQLLTNLQPSGDAWPADGDAVQQQALLALAPSFTALHARANALVDDAFPDRTVELLPQWEASLGLPDQCTPLGATLRQRQQAVVAKLIALGGQSIPYLTAFAAALGYGVTITQFGPFVADASHAGDAANSQAWAHAWQVNVGSAITDTWFTAGVSTAGDFLDVYQTGVLECRLRAIAPAHTVLLFAYSAQY